MDLTCLHRERHEWCLVCARQTIAELSAEVERLRENARVALTAWGEDANAADPVVAVIVLATAWKAECELLRTTQ